MLLAAAMFGVPLVSFAIDDTVPGVRVEASAPRDVDSLDLERPRSEGVSRGRIALVGAEVVATTTTTSTAPPTTLPPTTVPPTTAKPTTTTAKPTTTTAKPTTTTAKPTTTTTAKPTTTTAKPTTTTAAPARTEEGDASYYSAADPAECAHRTLPFGTIVTVTNVANGARTTCRVGDRGPFVDGRVIDLSRERFAELAPLSEGVIRVRIEW
jgi:rare lipoprotein A